MPAVSARAIQDWERGRRTTTGPAMSLLGLYEAMPEATTRVLAEHPALRLEGTRERPGPGRMHAMWSRKMYLTLSRSPDGL